MIVDVSWSIMEAYSVQWCYEWCYDDEMIIDEMIIDEKTWKMKLRHDDMFNMHDMREHHYYYNTIITDNIINAGRGRVRTLRGN